MWLATQLQGTAQDTAGGFHHLSEAVAVRQRARQDRVRREGSPPLTQAFLCRFPGSLGYVVARRCCSCCMAEPPSAVGSEDEDDPLFGDESAWGDTGDASSETSSEGEDEPAQEQQQSATSRVARRGGPLEPRQRPPRPHVVGSASDRKIAEDTSVRGLRRAVRAEGERSDSVALADPTGSLNIAEIRPVAKEGMVCEELAATLGAAPPVIESRKLVAPLDGTILRNVLSQEECASLIAATDGMGYSFWDPDEKRRDFRSADTVEIHSKALAKALWTRILPHIADLTAVKVEETQARWEREIDGDWTAYGVNHELLFGRYREGGHFSPHTDGNTVVDFNNRSLYSMIVYLNDCADGGSTRMLVLEEGDSFSTDASGRFRGREENVVDSCPVEAGSVLLFYQNIVHEGEPVGAGSMKYIIRTDLMFQRNHPFCDSDSDVEAFRLMKEAEEIENTQQGPASANKAASLFRQAFRMSPALAKVYGS